MSITHSLYYFLCHISSENMKTKIAHQFSLISRSRPTNVIALQGINHNHVIGCHQVSTLSGFQLCSCISVGGLRSGIKECWPIQRATYQANQIIRFHNSSQLYPIWTSLESLESSLYGDSNKTKYCIFAFAEVGEIGSQTQTANFKASSTNANELYLRKLRKLRFAEVFAEVPSTDMSTVRGRQIFVKNFTPIL